MGGYAALQVGPVARNLAGGRLACDRIVPAIVSLPSFLIHSIHADLILRGDDRMILRGDDRILCQITSQTIYDSYAIALDDPDFIAGGLNRLSNIRPNRLFTADRHIILRKIGQITPEKQQEVILKIVEIIQS
ncbi:hypothetical protein VB714_23690 [Spirulina sp. 06S082]|nr:hypothetical protein [Spirulina sp. 06S082]